MMCSCSLSISPVTGPAHCLQFISPRLSQDIPAWAAGSPWNSMNINDTANLLQYNGKPDALLNRNLTEGGSIKSNPAQSVIRLVHEKVI